MRKDIGVKPYLYPMPVLMIGTYDENGKPDVMNMAWGGICGNDKVALNISKGHKTTKNILKNNAFTLAVADLDHLAEADYFGIASGNNVEDKFERTGLHAVKSARVNAPIIQEFPLTLECKVDHVDDSDDFRIVGEIVNVSVDEKVLDKDGNVDPEKLNAFCFDTFTRGYYKIGERAGDAWGSGKKFQD
jgi:flavin reductase (DIM6/NTAB) family NADH-FMN oxidoreductase RutF